MKPLPGEDRDRAPGEAGDAGKAGRPGTPDGAAQPGFGLSISQGRGKAPAPVRSSDGQRPHAPVLTLDQLLQGIFRADRVVLGRAISLVESSKTADQRLAQQLIERLLPRTGKSWRIGVTGMPGAGKSTFIDRFGSLLTREGKRVAVLTVDPSSAVTGGSILGDKTRMPRLAAEPNAFIRPSPSGGELGGVARKTRETVLVCEAAGFDLVLVETVGVGQSETGVAEMTDYFFAIMIPGAGDELQGIKRGLLELVDLIAINKADGDNLQRARAAAREYASALHLVSRRESGAQVRVLTCSALTGEGVDDIWAAIRQRLEALDSSGALVQRRHAQNLRWLSDLVNEDLRRMLENSAAARGAFEQARAGVLAGSVSPAQAAERIVDALRSELGRPTPVTGTEIAPKEACS